MKAFILAGGYGTRLRPLTNRTPKPLLELAGKPIIRWQIEWLSKNGVDSFVVGIGYLKHKIKNYFKGTNLDVEFIEENEPLGTGGAIKNAEQLLENEREFIAVNGDIISSLSPKKLSLRKSDIVSMALVPLKSPYGVIKARGSRIIEFREKPLLKGYWLNAGVYKISNKIFRMLPEKGSLEELFQKLAQKNKIGCTKFSDIYWRSVDSLKDMEEADKAIKSGNVY